MSNSHAKQSLAVLILGLLSIAAARADAPAGSCETVENSQSYLSGLCPSDHQDTQGNQQTSFTYHCEMTANDDFIVKEISKTKTCLPQADTTQANAADAPRSPAAVH